MKTRNELMRPVRPSVLVKVLFAILLVGHAGTVAAQTIKDVEIIDFVEGKDDDVFAVVEADPEFPGGMGELMKFLKNNIRYPAICQQQGIQGRVIVQFVVNTDGSITDATVVKSVHPHLDREAIRVINAMPKWTPGRQRGEAVRVRFTLPVNFRLAKETKFKATIVNENNEAIQGWVEKLPQFPEGEQAMRLWIKENMKYPNGALKYGKEGSVTVSFVVNTDGSRSKYKITDSTDPVFNGEALRLIRSMPKWEPAIQNGKPVRVESRVNVPFSLFPSTPKATESKTQTQTTKTKGTDNVTEISDKDEEIFSVVEKGPEFPGGMAELMKFLSKNVRYPAICQKQGIQGKVIVQFVVNTDGSITDARVTESVNPHLDKEALRVVSIMPKWTPATQKGVPVRTRFTLPVNFRLANK